MVMPWARATCPKSSWTLVTFFGFGLFLYNYGFGPFLWYVFGVDLSDFWLLWLCPGLEQLAQRVPGLLSLFLIFAPFCVVVFWVWTILCGIVLC